MENLGFLTRRVADDLREVIKKGYQTAPELIRPTVSMQAHRQMKDGTVAAVGAPFTPILIRFGLRNAVSTTGTPITTSTTDGEMLAWLDDVDELKMRDVVEWETENGRHVARISAIYPDQFGVVTMEIEMVQ